MQQPSPEDSLTVSPLTFDVGVEVFQIKPVGILGFPPADDPPSIPDLIDV
jgi:hypothetical protein